MKESTVFDRLLLLPLFQGMTKKDFMQIAERVPLGFYQKNKGSVLAGQDELCDRLNFIMEGEVCSEMLSGNKDYRVKEWFNMPMVLQPESLFGITPRYSRTFIAASAVQLLQIEKDAIRDVLFSYPTFRINFLNLLSTRVQRGNRNSWRKTSNNLTHRFTQFLADRCLRPAGCKELCIKMRTLGEELLATRLNVSIMLNEMAEQGKIELRRGSIVIPNMEKLLM